MNDASATAWAKWAAAVVAVVALLVVVFSATDDETTSTITKRTTAADGTVTVEETTQPVDDSAWDQALSGGGDLLVKLALVAAASFVAGAVVQRTLLGRFAFKAGGWELPDISEATAESDEALAGLTKAVEDAQVTAERAAQDAADAMDIVLYALDAQDDEVP